MGELQFLCLNPDMSNAGAEFLSYTITQYLDRAGQFEGECSQAIPISVNGWLDVIYSGKIIHRGYIDTITPEDPETDSSEGTQSIISKDLWALLDNVFAQTYEFPALTQMNDLFSSDAPTPGKVIGLLAQLNGALPQGEATYTGSNEIYKYAGYGTSSRCGTLAVYVDTTLLTLGTSKTALTRGQYWRDATDLYIRCPDGRDPKYWCVSVTNYRDTRLRRGTITGGTTSFTVPYRITKGNFREIFEKIILALNCEKEFDHRSGTESVLGLTYLNLKILVGRGSETAPVTEFRADNVTLLNEETTGGEIFNAILAAGPGSGSTQVVAAKSDMMTRGAWREKLYSSSTLGEILSASLNKIWLDTSDPRCWSVKDADKITLSPGDYVLLAPRSSQNLVKRMKQIVHRSDSTMTGQANQRILTADDYMRARSTLLSEFNSFIATQRTSWSSSFGPTNIDDSDNPNKEFSGSAKFTINIPSNTIDTEFATQFLLTINIGAFESSLEGSQTPAHDNTGVAGSHSGYGGSGVNTNSAGKKTLGASSMTSAAAGAPFSVECAHRWHYHSGSVGAAGSHGHGMGYELWQTSYNGSPSHYHTYAVYDSVQSGGNHSHGTFNTGDAIAEGGTSWSYAASSNHYHYLPTTPTNTADDHPHQEALEAAKSRAVFEEPLAENILQQFKAMKDTGASVHYLDFYITFNGTAVSGSPFPNYYIGQSIADVDISNLIITGNNELEVKIKEHTSSLIPVRCSIRGSINATYYMPPNTF